MIKEDEQKLLAKLSNDRKKKIEPHVINLLLDMFERDLPVHDLDYVERRARQVIGEMIEAISFEDEEITKARKAFLKVVRKKWKQGVPARLEWRKQKMNKTEERDNRCEPVVYNLLEDLLKDDLILSDEDYVSLAISDQNKAMFTVCLFGYADRLFSELEISLNDHLSQATSILWGGKDKEEITMKQVEKVLLGAKKVAKKKK